jgi:hypothetical protein
MWKLRFLVREIAVGTLRNFGIPDSGQEKGAKKLQVQTKSKPSRKNISHISYLG